MPSRYSEFLDQIPLMRCVAMALVGNQDVADKMVENALLQVKDGRTRPNGGTNVRIILFSSLYRFARERSSEEQSAESRGSNSIDYFPGWNSREPISAAINGIDFDERFILILRSIGDFSYDELAEISGLSKRDVRTKIARAREELQSRLAELSGQKQNELRTKKSQSSGPELISGR